MLERITVLVSRILLEDFDDVIGCITQAATPKPLTLDQLLSRGWYDPRTKQYTNIPPISMAPEICDSWRDYVCEVRYIDRDAASSLLRLRAEIIEMHHHIKFD